MPVNIEGITVGIKRILKKPKSTMMFNFLWMILPTELQLDSNRKSHTMTCHLYQQNCRRIDR
jgi:hypothetical protein